MNNLPQDTFALVIDTDMEASEDRDKDMKKVIERLVCPKTPRMPTMTGYPKFHKNLVKVRPVISNINAPHSISSQWAAQHLNAMWVCFLRHI